MNRFIVANSYWKQFASITLVLLVLGPSFVTFFHNHDSHHASHYSDDFGGTGDLQFQNQVEDITCLICSFSFSIFDQAYSDELKSCDVVLLSEDHSLERKSLHSLLLVLDCIPRGPPVFTFQTV